MKDETVQKVENVLSACRLTGAEREFLERLLNDPWLHDLDPMEREYGRLREILQNHGMA